MSTINTSISRVTGNISAAADDFLAIEEPLEIRLSYVKKSQRLEKNISITMRTPGNDEQLATGFLFTEGIIENFEQIDFIDSMTPNRIKISLNENVDFDLKKLDRHFYTTSSCGVCGKSSIDALRTKFSEPINNTLFVEANLLYKLPMKLRDRQRVFDQTGGLHASAIFNAHGDIILLKEDVGRHNALDKLIGEALIHNINLENHILLLSGRASFELIQKAAVASIPFVAAIGAPSSLAVQLSKECGMTLVGFLKPDQFNIYWGVERVKMSN